MASVPDEHASDFDILRSHLAAWHQEHVLRWWEQLTTEQRAALRAQLLALDLPALHRLFDEFRASQTRATTLLDVSQVHPWPALRLPHSPEDRRRETQATTLGEQALRARQVAVLLVAGGQGSRLGFDGPKGTYPLGPVSGKTLFQIHAEKLRSLEERYGPLPLYIMTSPETDAATREFFRAHQCFGLDPQEVVFFPQGTMPAVDRQTGSLLLAAKDRLATSPDGHGGVLRALASGGHLAALRQRGTRYVFYFQVDNPLVRIAEPQFLGHHIKAAAELSLKVVSKLNPEEKLGVVVERNGQPQIIEYSELPRELAERRGPDQSLEIWAGSIAVHVFDLGFLERLSAEGRQLPWHPAVRKSPALDEQGEPVNLTEPNAVKFESFVFDVLPLARKVLVVETDRRQEFEPLKNAQGDNSPETVRRALSAAYGDWDLAPVQLPWLPAVRPGARPD
jgi:UDP-N-acetylglucosamine/UDP-N-acetylgalactosamine diphosphorylase